VYKKASADASHTAAALLNAHRRTNQHGRIEAIVQPDRPAYALSRHDATCRNRTPGVSRAHGMQPRMGPHADTTRLQPHCVAHAASARPWQLLHQCACCSACTKNAGACWLQIRVGSKAPAAGRGTTSNQTTLQPCTATPASAAGVRTRPLRLLEAQTSSQGGPGNRLSWANCAGSKSPCPHGGDGVAIVTRSVSMTAVLPSL
jgi:hypothetical protein